MSGRDGAPQLTCVWVAVEGDDLLTAHLNPRQRKLENVQRDPRVAVSFEGTEIQPRGLREYVVVYGRAKIEEGGAPELLQDLSRACTSAPRCAFRRWMIPRPASGCGSRSRG
jgi:nitroimidazol reductase NimA-like FMN-containing flavoprotein (pyridoxamine 5'-phosphate oxidase superfamily)